jgi:hypothetical protein
MSLLQYAVMLVCLALFGVAVYTFLLALVPAFSGQLACFYEKRSKLSSHWSSPLVSGTVSCLPLAKHDETPSSLREGA